MEKTIVTYMMHGGMQLVLVQIGEVQMLVDEIMLADAQPYLDSPALSPWTLPPDPIVYLEIGFRERMKENMELDIRSLLVSMEHPRHRNQPEKLPRLCSKQRRPPSTHRTTPFHRRTGCRRMG